MSPRPSGARFPFRPVATVEAASGSGDNGPVAAELTYPFVPDSNRRLRAGQFWGIPQAMVDSPLVA